LSRAENPAAVTDSTTREFAERKQGAMNLDRAL
jgi:hypothetical protein